MKPTYTALAERSGSWWAIRVAELPGVFSQARRLEGVEYMARDAISLLLDIPTDSFDVQVREVLDPEADVLIAEAIQARAVAIEHQRLAASKSREAVRTLDRLGLPQGLVPNLGLHDRQATARPGLRQVFVPTTRTPLTAGYFE